MIPDIMSLECICEDGMLDEETATFAFFPLSVFQTAQKFL